MSNQGERVAAVRAPGPRRRLIMAASVVPLLPRGPGPSGPATGPLLSVLATNVEQSHRDAEVQARAVLSVDADVVCLIEASETTVAALDGSAIAATHPHRSDDHDPGSFGSFIASRHPITRRWTGDVGGRPGHWVDLDVAGTPVRVIAVHTQAPIHDHDVAVWHRTIAATAALAADTGSPVVLAGDWNATGGHRPFRRALADHGLVDAQARRGHRWWPTWPVDSPVFGLHLPPVLALDHVVVTPDVQVHGLERIAIPACDHRAVRAAVRLPADR